MLKKLTMGDISFIIKSINPEDLKAPIATNNPTNVGKSFITISIPSFAPSKNVSKTLFFSINAYVNINKIVVGTAKFDK